MIPAHDLPRTVTCPHCSHVWECVTNAGRQGPVLPAPGQLGICWRCGDISIFDESLQLRVMNETEARELLADPALLLHLARLQHACRVAKALRN